MLHGRGDTVIASHRHGHFDQHPASDDHDAANPTTSMAATSVDTPGASDWASIVQTTRGAVVRLEVATCDERWMGTGFAIAPNRIVTAAHVAAGAVSIGVQGEGVITTARVVDYDKDADVALLQSRDPLPKSLTVADKHAPLGSALALLGFPDAVTDLRVTQGIVSGVDASVDYGPPTNTSLTHVLATDAAINGGNSGGPALDHAGQVIGLVTGKQILNIDETPAEGTGYVVPSDQLIPRLDAWKEKAPAPAGPGCDGARGGANTAGPVVDVKVASADAQDIARSLATHGGAIDAGGTRSPGNSSPHGSNGRSPRTTSGWTGCGPRCGRTCPWSPQTCGVTPRRRSSGCAPPRTQRTGRRARCAPTGT